MKRFRVGIERRHTWYTVEAKNISDAEEKGWDKFKKEYPKEAVQCQG